MINKSKHRQRSSDLYTTLNTRLENMHLYLFSFQAILLAVFVINYHYIDEVEAEKHFSVGNWFNSMERKVDVQGTMNRLLGKFRTTADQVIDIPRRLTNPPEKDKKKIKLYEEDDNLAAYVNHQELADRNPVTALDASDVTKENETEPETTINEVTEKQETHKKKRRAKKHKRKHKPKPKPNPKPQPEQIEEQQEPQELQEQKVEVTTEREIVEFARTFQRKEHKRKSRKKFVKMAPKGETRNATIIVDSDEKKSRKPVDIIVHIKMND